VSAENDMNVREKRAEAKVRIRRRGIYLLPNLLTLSALFFGFYAILQAINQDFDKACVAVFVAMVLDSLDGRVARMTKTQSAFGAELDSLSDMVSFGAAPAIVVYEWAISAIAYRQLGMVVAFVYCACAALRLARFNVQINVVDKRFFSGLPSPAAAALVTGFIWVCNDLDYSGPDVKWWALGVTVFAGLSMVTTAKFYSFKTINLKRSVPFFALAACVLVYALVSIHPPSVLFAAFMVYAVSGYIYTAFFHRKTIPAEPEPDPLSDGVEDVAEDDKKPDAKNAQK
jgi:CDP-diacylglycerol---serine O-phosphatidyltransferase